MDTSTMSEQCLTLYKRILQHKAHSSFAEMKKDIDTFETIANEQNDRYCCAAAQTLLANYYVDTGDFDKSLFHAMNCVDIANIYHFQEFEMKGYNIMGIAYSNMMEYHLSLDMYLKAFYICKEYPELGFMGLLLNNIGNLFSTLEQYEQALDYYKRAIVNLKGTEYDNDRLHGLCVLNVVETCFMLQRYDEAEQWLKKGKPYFKDTDNIPLRCQLLMADAFRNVEAKQIQKAKDIFYEICDVIADSLEFTYLFNVLLSALKVSLQLQDIMLCRKLIESMDQVVMQMGSYSSDVMLQKMKIEFCICFELQEELHAQTMLYFDMNERAQLISRNNYGQSLQAKITLERRLYEQRSIMKKNEELMRINELDPSTKLMNKKAIQEYINAQLQVHDQQTLSAIFVLDIDLFKHVNDTYGHLTGDFVIEETANTLRSLFRKEDAIGRIGGDEFIIFMEHVYSEEFIYEMAEKTLRQMMRISVSSVSKIPITVSLGVAIIANQEETYTSLFSKADRALYEAKANGRNQYVIYERCMSDELHPTTMVEERDHIHFSIHYIMSNVYEMLNNRQDNQQGLPEILNFVQKALGIDTVFLLELNDKTKMTGTYYQSHMLQYKQVKKQLEGIPWIDDNLQHERYNADGLYRCDDALLIDHEAHSKAGILEGNAHLHQLLYQDDQLIGLIGFSNREKHIWNHRDITTIASLARVFASYFGSNHAVYIKENYEPNAHKDSLTTLSSLDYFLQSCSTKLQTQEANTCALLHFDIANFRYINDTYGYIRGNKILRMIGELLLRICKQEDLCARLYADHFVVLCRHYKKFISSLESMIHTEISLRYGEGMIIDLSLIFGVYVVKSQQENMLHILDKANLALKEAKRKHQHIVVFDHEMLGKLQQSKQMENSMRKALDHKEFKVYIQAKVGVVFEDLAGGEALVRWDSSDMGFLPPNSFIPLFEENGFIKDLDFYVLECVCIQMRNMIDHSEPLRPVSVNQSRLTIQSPNYLQRLNALVDRYDIPHEQILLEVTESVFIDNEKIIRSIITKVRKQGYRISMDDFGSGYSSLNFLRKLPIDELKIDREFLNENFTSKKTKLIIRKVIELAKALQVKVVCEGVENQQQVDFLKECGCDMIQGYIYHKPQDMKSFYEGMKNRPVGKEFQPK